MLLKTTEIDWILVKSDLNVKQKWKKLNESFCLSINDEHSQDSRFFNMMQFLDHHKIFKTNSKNRDF